MNAPGWIFTLWGGVLADRKDRRKIILLLQGVQLACVILLVALLVLGWLKVWMIVVISFLVGLTDSLSMLFFQSIIPSIVDPREAPKRDRARRSRSTNLYLKKRHPCSTFYRSRNNALL